MSTALVILTLIFEFLVLVGSQHAFKGLTQLLDPTKKEKEDMDLYGSIFSWVLPFFVATVYVAKAWETLSLATLMMLFVLFRLLAAVWVTMRFNTSLQNIQKFEKYKKKVRRNRKKW